MIYKTAVAEVQLICKGQFFAAFIQTRPTLALHFCTEDCNLVLFCSAK